MNSTLPWPSNLSKQSAADVHLRGERQVAHRSKTRRTGTSAPLPDVPSLVKPSLGPLECEVLRELCGTGELSARQVLERMPRPLAYTTLSTTLARLYRKGLLSRRLLDKSFLYTSRLSSAQLELQLARDLVKALTRCTDTASDQLAAAIVEVMHGELPELLQELKRAIADEADES